MDAKYLKNLILSLTQDVVFKYNNGSACINPMNINKFEVGFKDAIKMYQDIDDLFADKIFDGKSLNEIAEKIELEF
jgi:hypothetical protein